MRLLQIKNYRSIKYISINLNQINLFIGENNTGKTSLMRLISSIGNSNQLDFEGTWLKKINIKDIINEENAEIIIFNGSFHKHKNDEKIKYFELIKISTIKDYYKPLITEIITTDTTGTKFVKFKIEYNDFNKKDKLLIKKITLFSIENNLINLKGDFDNKINYIEKLDELFKIEKSDEVSFEIESKDILEKKYDNLRNRINDIENFSDINDNKEHNLIHKELLLVIIKLNINFSKNNRLAIYLLYSFYIYYLNNSNDLNIIINHDEGLRAFDIHNNFKYINPLRAMFKESYDEEEFNNINLINENDVLYYLKFLNQNNHPDLVSLVNNFYAKAFSIKDPKIEIKDLGFLDKSIYIPTYSLLKRDKLYNLRYSGTGISQVLPIVVQLYQYVINKKISSLCIEQPEIHLHPKAQLELGNCLYEVLGIKDDNELYKENIIIETHSSFLIDSLRLNIWKNENIKKHNSELSLFFLF